MSLTTRVLIALVAGVGVGVAIASSGSPRLASAALAIEPLGTLWINAIRMTVIPLVVGSLIVGITSAPDAKSIGRVGRGKNGCDVAGKAAPIVERQRRTARVGKRLGRDLAERRASWKLFDELVG